MKVGQCSYTHISFFKDTAWVSPASGDSDKNKRSAGIPEIEPAVAVEDRLADILGVKRNTIYRWLRVGNVCLPKRGPRS